MDSPIDSPESVGNSLTPEPTVAESGGWSWSGILAVAAGVVVTIGAIAYTWRSPPIASGPGASAPAPLPSTIDSFVSKPPQAGHLAIATDLPELAAPSNPGYLGPHACAPCHAERVDEFLQTSHFRTCRRPDPATMGSGFTSENNTYVSRVPGLKFEMSRVGDEFFQTAVQQTIGGVNRTRSRIDLVYGAGTADEVFLSWHDDGELLELPVAWLTTTREWAVSHFNPYSAGDFARPLTLRCFECHMTWFEHVAGSANQYRQQNAILGVTCERCHGPGRDHVQHHEKNPQDDVPHAIVQPVSLSRDRQTDLCIQCHSNYINPRGPALSYRPGEPLDHAYRPVTPKHSEDDHVANQIHYLKQSACFQKSDTLTCITCHDPHEPPSDSHTRLVQNACSKCHQPADCGEQPRLPEAVRPNCTGCHMPKRIKVNVNFQTKNDDFVPPILRFDHRIAVNPLARDEVLLAWYRTQSDEPSRQRATELAASLVDHWLQEADKCRDEFRYLGASAAIREAIRVEPSAELDSKLREHVALQTKYLDEWHTARHQIATNQNSAAMDTLQRILEMNPNDAKAHGKMGLLLAMVNRRAEAEKQFQEVRRCDSDDPYGEGMLGWLAYLDGHPDTALDHYRVAIEIEPFYDKLHHQMGLALGQLGQLPQAIDQLRLALRINPQRADSCYFLALAFRQQNKPAEALPYAKKAVELTSSGNPDFLLALADVYADLGQIQEALKMAGTALNLIPPDHPSRNSVQQRINQMKKE